MLRVKGNYKKKLKLKAITRTKWEETKKLQQKQQKREMQENKGCMMNSALEA